MPVIKWNAPDSSEIVLNTELNALADGSNKITSSAVSNDQAGELDMFGDFQLYLATQGSARSATAHVKLYLLPGIDGDFAYGGDSLDPAVEMLVGSFSFDAAVTARYAHLRGILLPPMDFYGLVINETGQVLAATLNVLTLQRYNVQSN